MNQPKLAAHEGHLSGYPPMKRGQTITPQPIIRNRFFKIRRKGEIAVPLPKDDKDQVLIVLRSIVSAITKDRSNARVTKRFVGKSLHYSLTADTQEVRALIIGKEGRTIRAIKRIGYMIWAQHRGESNLTVDIFVEG